uniref:Platelet endothelial cell adhesion molecule n=1 Tax=Carassius gibelio TaxID=101364 RepID=A0A4Y5SUA9_CARGB|nr:platelet endothelial cell adhesion molecule [Carassius gibelio]
MAMAEVQTSLPMAVPAVVLRAVDKVIVGKPFTCEADGTPITYTLLKTSVPVDQVIEAADRAINITSISPDIDNFRCQAYNNVRLLSKTSLRATVIVPAKPELKPKEVTVTETDLILICSVHHSDITFTWYYNRVKLPSSKEVRSLEGRYVVAIERGQRGDYYCEASNNANAKSPARIGVRALWKKVLIGVFCILLVAIVIVLTVLLSPHEQATELSVPSRPSGDMRISLTLDIEDNTALNGTCVMGRNVWSDVSGSDSDDHTDDSELLHPQEVDSSGDVVKITTEPEHSVQDTDVQVSTPGAEQADVTLEYAQLNNSEQEPRSDTSHITYSASPPPEADQS